MTAAALAPLNTEPLVEYRVHCEVEAEDGIHRLCLLVLAADEDDAGDQALYMLDRSRISKIVHNSCGGGRQVGLGQGRVGQQSVQIEERQLPES